MEWARITYSLAASVTLLAATGCLRFDGPTGLEGYCWDWATEAYVVCDAGVTDASASDALPSDAMRFDAAIDAGAVDLGVPDSGEHLDAEPLDSGLVDSGEHLDAEPLDSGFVDSGAYPDADLPDQGMPDSGVHPDAEVPDQGTPDAGFVDAGLPDSGLSPDSGFVNLTITVTKILPRDQVSLQTHQGAALCGFLIPSPCVLPVPAFALQPLRAAPDTSSGGTGTSSFSVWTGAASACGSNLNCTVFTSGDLSIGAEFVP